ncbi:MAG: hypothetical protein HYT27_02405 [Parcubacteria group bacterium]|nr:hypothetical protein [Parcubacteria group bacterium]
MKLSPLTFLLLVVFVGISSFGFLAMNHNVSLIHDGCLASAMTRTTCLEAAHSLSFINFHVNALKNFSNAFVNTNLLTLLLFIASVLVVFSRMRRVNFVLRAPLFYFYFTHFFSLFATQPLHAILYWLAFREHSPTLS